MGFQSDFHAWRKRAIKYLADRQNRVAKWREQYDTFNKTKPQFEPRLRDLCASYHPGLTQAALDAAVQSYPAPTDELLKAEMLRIRDHLTPMTDGWPLDTKDRIFKRLLQDAWRDVQARLHVQVFGSLDLPRFYRIHHGFCSYEATSLRRNQFGQSRHIGVQSGHDYGQVKPILWRHLT
ncbi:MAG: hypothetical protein IOD00_17015 [Rhodobacter sp.]|nr:hypothetical protein [Rhodobacter sp.]MCA3482299.1 hypothetical protein [Rhodobacter sp.]